MYLFTRSTAKYAIRDMVKPMAISTYHIGPALPPQFKEQLPDMARLKDLILKTPLDAGG